MPTKEDEELTNALLELLESHDKLSKSRETWGYGSWMNTEREDRYNAAIARYTNADRTVNNH